MVIVPVAVGSSPFVSEEIIVASHILGSGKERRRSANPLEMAF